MKRILLAAFFAATVAPAQLTDVQMVHIYVKYETLKQCVDEDFASGMDDLQMPHPVTREWVHHVFCQDLAISIAKRYGKQVLAEQEAQ